jgi:hypothetical protein
MNLFYYTSAPEEGQEVFSDKGYSFDIDAVLLTYPNKNGLSVVLNGNADKLNPIDYQYKIDPTTKQRVPVKVSKFEITSEPIVITITSPEEIERFYQLTGGPTA